MARRRDRRGENEIVSERISILFAQADAAAAGGDVGRASALVRSAVSLSSRYNFPLPAGCRRRICKHCKAYLSSANSRRRLNPRHRRVEATCLECGGRTYLPYGRAGGKAKP